MASKNINVLMSFVDKFTKPFSKVEASTKKAQKQFKLAQNTVNGFGRSANKAFLNVAGSVAKFGTALAGIGFAAVTAGIGKLASESMELADAQIKAETELETMLGNVASLQAKGGDAVKNAADSLKSYASELQNVGVVGDEVTLSGMAQLATFQMNDEQIKTVSASMLDLLVKNKGLNATQQDAVNIANMIGKAYTGQATALSRVGITMSEEQKEIIKNGDANQRAAMIAKVLADNVGGMNKAMAKTDAGKAQQAMNAYGDMLEEVGKKVRPMKTALWSAFGDVLPKLQETLLPVLDKILQKFTAALPTITNMINGAVDKLPAIIDSIGNGLSWLADNWDTILNVGRQLLPVITGIVAGFSAFNVISKVVVVFDKLKDVMNGVKIAGSALKFALTLNPIGLVAAAVGVLVVALVACYKKSETFRNAVNNLWAKLQELGAKVAKVLAPLLAKAWDFIGVGFGVLVDALAVYFTRIVDGLSGIIDFIVGVFSGDWERAWNGIVTAFKNIFSLVASVALAPLKAIMGVVDTILSKIQKCKVPKSEGGGEEHNATGTSYFKGGRTFVNENNRGELINLPSGAQIIPHDLSVKALQGSRPSINISLNVAGNVIGNDDFYNRCGEIITKKVITALGNV